ncbi:MAG TPA: TolC family protein, partial [Candidatus Acidoferrum sp.]
MKNLYKYFVLTLPLMLAGCTLHPKYTRPDANIPVIYRDEAPKDAQERSFGDARWWEVFQDPELQSLIRTALQQNFDIRIAASRIEQARAQLGITRSNQYPNVAGGATATVLRSAQGKFSPASQLNLEDLSLSASWEIDFWGKYRSATEAARAQLVATEWGRRAVLSSLVANIANGYFQLRGLDLELEIARRTLG